MIKEKITNSKIYQKVIKSETYNDVKNYLGRHTNVKYVLFLYMIAFLLFAITLINNQFTIPLGGDFVLQEIPFYYNGYDDWWTYLTKGEFVFWDENTNLGANNIGSNSFYYLLNIFFLPTLLVPRALVPQMQAFLMITKLVLAGYVMKRLLTDQFGIKEDTAQVMGVAYAFCGWNLYYLWFNHFLEIAVIFPFVLYGIEVVLKERRPSVLMISLVVSALTNYFFFIMICFCSVIYAIFRYFQLFNKYDKKEKWKVIGIGFTSYCISMIMALVILLPAFSVAMQSSRAGSSSYTTQIVNSLNAILTSLKYKDFSTLGLNIKAFFNSLIYFSNGSGGATTNVSNITRVYLYPLMTFFYPTVSCNSHLLIKNNGYDNALSSLFVYTPVMLMMIPSFFQSIKERKVSHIIGVIGMLILIFTPFAYYCFSGFTNVCYGRWQLFPVICMIIYAAINFDKRKELKSWFFDVSLIVCLGMEILLLTLGKNLQGSTSVGQIDPDAFNVCYAQMIYLVLLYLYFKWKKNDKEFMGNLKWAVSLEALVSFNLLLGFTISIGDQNLYIGFFGTTDYENLYGGQDSVNKEYKILAKLKDDDDSFYRVYNTSLTRSINNLGMVEGYNGLGAFHSIYNFEIDDFAMWTHFKYNGSWSMGAHEKKINMDSFLNVKYYLLDKKDNNIPFGLTKILEQDGKVLYRNDNYVPLGYNFDEIVSADDVNHNLRVTDGNNYYLNYRNYSAYVPKAEYMLTSKAMMYEDDLEEIFAKYPEFEDNYKKDVNYSNDFNGKVYVKTLADNEVSIERALWDDGPGGSGNYIRREDPVPYSRTAATGLKWNSLVKVKLKNPICVNATSQNKAYVTVNARLGENLIITLRDKNGKEIVHDNHMHNAYNKQYDRKFERGFYVDRPVYSIDILVKDTFKKDAVLAKPNLSYQYYSTYKENMDKLKETQFTNVVRGVNTYSFDSSLDHNMISVLSIPYDKGWNLTRTDEQGKKEKVDIYKGQGGFVSFVNESGDNHYDLRYETPYLYPGMFAFIIGSMLFASFYYSLEVIKSNKKEWEARSKFE